MSACQRSKAPDRKRPRSRSVALRLAQRAAIAGAGVLVMISGTGIAGLPGQARADTPQCVADQTDPCPPPADGSVDPSTPPRVQQRMANRPRLQIICQPAAKVGAFCYRRIVR